MIHQHIAEIIQRDLSKVKEELLLYPDSESVWKVVPGITNSGGNLCLHLAGNLRHFIGAVIGNTGYIRERDLEFSSKGYDAAYITDLLDKAAAEVAETFKNLDPEILTKSFPKDVGGIQRDTHYVLLHLMAHLSYHLGQINYHRRIITSSKN